MYNPSMPFDYDETVLGSLFKLDSIDKEAIESCVILKNDNEPFNSVSAIKPMKNKIDFFHLYDVCKDMVVDLPENKQYVKYYDEGNVITKCKAILYKDGFWKDVDLGTHFVALFYLPLKDFSGAIKLQLVMPAYYGVKEDISEYKKDVFNMAIAKARKMDWVEYIDEIQTASFNLR